MLERILKLYTTCTMGDVRSPLPHLFGPAGCNKSTAVYQAGELLGVNVHTVNVSRVNVIELEGIQMPVDDNTRLHMLPATFWTQLKEGDILFLDEFLRGFPEIYNGLLDILTSRTVGNYRLPKVFIIAASNTVVAYDKALEDRLHHLPVPDARKSQAERKLIAQVIVDLIGLNPDVLDSSEMHEMIRAEVLPMYEVMDQLSHKAMAGSASTTGHSPRNLVGQAKMRDVTCDSLIELIELNNQTSIAQGKWQYVILLSGTGVDPRYIKKAQSMLGNPALTELERLNIQLNLQLIAAARSRKERYADAGTE